jgi:hypothetical protein
VVIDRLTRSRAIRLQYRLHALRKAMREELHEYRVAAERCVVRSPKPTQGTSPEGAEADPEAPVWEVVVEPADADFASDLKRAGVEVTEEDLALPEEPAASHPQAGDDAADAVRRFLNQE